MSSLAKQCSPEPPSVSQRYGFFCYYFYSDLMFGNVGRSSIAPKAGTVLHFVDVFFVSTSISGLVLTS